MGTNTTYKNLDLIQLCIRRLWRLSVRERGNRLPTWITFLRANDEERPVAVTTGVTVVVYK